MKGKELKNIKTPLTLAGKTYMVAFDFNTLVELEDVYEGGLELAMQSLSQPSGNKLRALRAIIYSMIKPSYDSVTVKEIGEKLTSIFTNPDELNEILKVIEKAYTLSMPQAEEVESESVEGE